MGQLVNLLDDVQLYQTIDAGLLRRQALDAVLMQAVDVLDMHQPVIDQGQIRALLVQRRLDAAAGIVAADDDVLHFEHLYRVFHHAQAVAVRGDDLIGNVAMHEDFARGRVDDDLRGDAAVGTPNPEEIRLLLFELPLKKSGIMGDLFLGPGLVFQQ